MPNPEPSEDFDVITRSGSLVSPSSEYPTTPRITLAVVGDPTPPYVPSFMLPLGTKDYRYGKPTAMMAGLQSHTSTFEIMLGR